MARSSKKKKKTAKRKTKKKSGGGFKPLVAVGGLWNSLTALPWPRISRWTSVAAWIVGAGAVILACTFGVPKLESAVAAMTDEHEGAQVQFVDLPGWVRGDLLASWELTASRQLSHGPLDRDDLVKAREALLATGWFETVDQVRRISDEEVSVRATFVRPFVVVRDDDGDHLVDPSGTLLPRTYTHGEAGPLMIVVTGSRYRRPRDTGSAWEGQDVSAALRLLRMIDKRPWRGQVARVDVGHYLDRQELVLITDRGSNITWGAAPGEETALEMLAKRKMEFLDFNFEHVGHIDRGFAGDLYFTKDGLIAR